VKTTHFSQVGIVGASGYSRELVRLLLTHPNAELSAITSRQHAGKALTEVFPSSLISARRRLRFSKPESARLARERK